MDCSNKVCLISPPFFHTKLIGVGSPQVLSPKAFTLPVFQPNPHFWQHTRGSRAFCCFGWLSNPRLLFFLGAPRKPTVRIISYFMKLTIFQFLLQLWFAQNRDNPVSLSSSLSKAGAIFELSCSSHIKANFSDHFVSYKAPEYISPQASA